MNINKLEFFPTCGNCGAEVTKQSDFDSLVYSRTTSESDHYYCPICGCEGISIATTKEEEEAKKETPRYHYMCEDKEKNIFFTTERCATLEEAQEYVDMGGNKAIKPFYDNMACKNCKFMGACQTYSTFATSEDWFCGDFTPKSEVS